MRSTGFFRIDYLQENFDSLEEKIENVGEYWVDRRRSCRKSNEE